jgi:hypothetical protein
MSAHTVVSTAVSCRHSASGSAWEAEAAAAAERQNPKYADSNACVVTRFTACSSAAGPSVNSHFGERDVLMGSAV